LAKLSSGAIRNATSKLLLVFRGGTVVVVVGRLGEYEGVVGGAGDLLLSGDPELLVVVVVVVAELLVLLRAKLRSRRAHCCMLMSIVILMGRRSAAKGMIDVSYASCGLLAVNTW
jgi:predicted branched-subunit amino acid permease